RGGPSGSGDGGGSRGLRGEAAGLANLRGRPPGVLPRAPGDVQASEGDRVHRDAAHVADRQGVEEGAAGAARRAHRADAGPLRRAEGDDNALRNGDDTEGEETVDGMEETLGTARTADVLDPSFLEGIDSAPIDEVRRRRDVAV